MTFSTAHGSGFNQEQNTQISITEDSNLIPVTSLNRICNAITTNKAGKTFIGFPSTDGPGLQLAELFSDGTVKPYPDEQWNRIDEQHSPEQRFVRVNAVRFGPDGNLWVIDAGAPGTGKEAIPGGGRLFVYDTAQHILLKTYDLAAYLKTKSYVDDIRFNQDFIYITDAGEPGLIILNWKTGAARRILDQHYSTTDQRSMYADGKLLLTEEKEELRVHADQLEVSPDGQWFYYQPCSGPTYRIATRYLDDFSTGEDTIKNSVEAFFDGPTTGGTAISASGTIYYNDAEKRRILKIDQNGNSSVLVEDKRLIWADAMWIDTQGWLWIPVTQQNYTPGFTGGEMKVEYPVWLYKYKINEQPSPLEYH